MSSNIARDRLQSASTPLASVDEAPVKHFHLKGRSSIPSLLRGADAFTITRLESSSGLPERITKVSSVPALLVAVSIKSLAIKRLSVLGRREARPNTLRSIVPVQRHRSGCATRLLGGKRLRLRAVSCASQGPGRHRGRSRRWSRGDLPGLGSGRRSCSEPTDQEHSSPHRAARLAVPLALDHLNLILGAHLLQKYGGLRKPPTVSVGGLGPWQKRRATELLSENLSGRIRLSQVAQECGLSISHFARSFKASFGVSTHRWLVQRRIERSQELLIHTRESLSDIAEQAGFADQAAFTRTFHQIVGVSPGRWRRDYQPRESGVALA